MLRGFAWRNLEIFAWNSFNFQRDSSLSSAKATRSGSSRLAVMLWPPWNNIWAPAGRSSRLPFRMRHSNPRSQLRPPNATTNTHAKRDVGSSFNIPRAPPPLMGIGSVFGLPYLVSVLLVSMGAYESKAHPSQLQSLP